MSDVYNNATVTLSADSSLNSSEGLFPSVADREPKVKRYEIASKAPDDQPSVIYVRRRFGDPFAVQNTVHSNVQPEEIRLNTRGWVLQEELPSPRTLHFKKEEISWTCSAYTRCECRYQTGTAGSSPPRASEVTFKHSPESTYLIHLEWPLIIMDFTRRNLTFVGDRLLAMSGLAGWIEKRTTDTYFAGLWYEDLAYQLMWYSDVESDDPNRPKRMSNPYAPSWSWASISKAITFFARYASELDREHPAYVGASVRPIIIPINVWAKPSGANKYGPVSFALLQAIAHVLPVQYDRPSNQWLPQVPVQGLRPERLKVLADVPSELLEVSGRDSEDSYALMLAARWSSAERVTALSSQALCFLVRKLSRHELEPLLPGDPAFRDAITQFDSYVRVGVVKFAGSLEGWAAAVQKSGVNLL
jgi:hypothetical protein